MSDAPSCIKICQWDSDLALNYENVVEKVVYLPISALSSGAESKR